MTVKTIRHIVNIDEEKCNGCGACATKCAEGALQIIDGKAKLISETYCDGLGACLGECPQGAITIEEREAEQFDLAAVEQHQKAPCSCPSAAVHQLKPEKAKTGARATTKPSPQLRNFPVQLGLVPVNAPFLQGADLLLAADCVPFAYPGFHSDFLENHALIITCPKLDDFPAHLAKLTEIFKRSDLKSLTIVHMEVPCCSGLVYMAKEALKNSGKNIPVREVTIGIKGDIISDE